MSNHCGPARHMDWRNETPKPRMLPESGFALLRCQICATEKPHWGAGPQLCKKSAGVLLRRNTVCGFFSVDRSETRARHRFAQRLHAGSHLGTRLAGRSALYRRKLRQSLPDRHGPAAGVLSGVRDRRGRRNQWPCAFPIVAMPGAAPTGAMQKPVIECRVPALRPAIRRRSGVDRPTVARFPLKPGISVRHVARRAARSASETRPGARAQVQPMPQHAAPRSTFRSTPHSRPATGRK